MSDRKVRRSQVRAFFCEFGKFRRGQSVLTAPREGPTQRVTRFAARASERRLRRQRSPSVRQPTGTRRFPDKDALLETVILGILERQQERLRVALTPEMARQIPLAVFAEHVITSMLISYRASAGLLRAVRQFVQARDQTVFYKKAAKLEMQTFQYLMELFLVHRKEIRHRDPQVAVAFALVTLSSTLIELILVDHDLRCWQVVIPKDDQTLKRELLRNFLSYLGVGPKNG